MRRARIQRSVEQESDDFVSIETKSEYEAQVRVTCPDKTGLGSDITRTIFDFGLVTTKGDFATDGKWAFVLVTVMKQSAILNKAGNAGPGVNWMLLKQRLENLCPSKQSISTLSTLNLTSMTGAGGDSTNNLRDYEKQQKKMYILQVEVSDRVGLLHDVTQELWASELTVHRAHISTSPADTAVDLFYVTDEKNELPSETRVAEISTAVQRVAGRRVGGGTGSRGQGQGTGTPVGTAGGTQTCHVVITPAPSFVTQSPSASLARLFETNNSIGRVETASATQYTSATVSVDNLMSDKHTVFQIRTRDRKGLLYDVLRASKDLEVKVNYAKVVLKVDTAPKPKNDARPRPPEFGDDESPNSNPHKAQTHLCEIDLFVGRCPNAREREYLCQRYKENVERPVSVQIMTGGLDETTTELRVIAPLDISGFTRPRVLLDVTEALRQLKVMVFKADILIDDNKPGDHGSGDGNHAHGSATGDASSDGYFGGGRGKLTRRQEVHRFLLTDAHGQPIASVRDRKVVVNRVLGVLLQ